MLITFPQLRQVGSLIKHRTSNVVKKCQVPLLEAIIIKVVMVQLEESNVVSVSHAMPRIYTCKSLV
uniref:Uncharacterized protein n=1 Tax=Octopus bimaculoides TaxID=37653 RepID=A0A0L8HH87_OCTBM